MKRSLIRLIGVVAIVVGGAAGCADQGSPVASAAPLEVEVGGPFLSVSPAEQSVRVLERDVPLAEALSASRVIGPNGGMIEIADAGLRLHVPAGAVTVPTEITVTAPAGSLVAYTFEPHGTRFHRVVTAEQTLAGTTAAGGAERVSTRGYFTSAAAINDDAARAVVSEVSLVQQDEQVVRFFLNHFSGYLVAID